VKISFGHHLSLSYFGGGEKWIIQVANELASRGHEVDIHALPILLDGEPKVNPRDHLNPNIKYSEGYHHKLRGDVNYITYNPLSWVFFDTSHPKIAGIHSHAYWQKLDHHYGLLPNLANLVNKVIGGSELNRFDAVHAVTDVYEINHPNVKIIPNFVDSKQYDYLPPKYKEFTVGYASRKVWQKGYDIYETVRREMKNEAVFIETNNIPEKLMPMWLSQPHALIVPARVNTFGLNIVESLLCKTPVIASNLITHKALHLPLIYASNVSEYVDNLLIIKESCMSEDYLKYLEKCRQEALKFDKVRIINRLEDFFTEVSA